MKKPYPRIDFDHLKGLPYALDPSVIRDVRYATEILEKALDAVLEWVDTNEDAIAETDPQGVTELSHFDINDMTLEHLSEAIKMLHTIGWCQTERKAHGYYDVRYVRPEK